MIDLQGVYLLTMGWAVALSCISVLRRRRPRSPLASIFGIDDAIMGGLGLIKGVADFFGNKSKDDAEKAAQLMYNEWLKDRSQTADQIASRLKANGIDIYGPQVTTSSSSGTSTSGTTYGSSTSASSRPVITAEYQPMEAQFRKLIQTRLGQPETVTEGEKAANLQRIGASTRAAIANLRNKVAGLNLAPNSLQAAMLANPPATAGQIAANTYLGETVPNLERSRRNEDLGLAQGAITAFGRGEDTKSRTSGYSNTAGTTMGSTTSTAPPDFASLFNILAPPAPQASGKTGNSPGWNAVGDASSALSQALMAWYKGRTPTTAAYPVPNWNPLNSYNAEMGP